MDNKEIFKLITGENQTNQSGHTKENNSTGWGGDKCIQYG